ncbi:MAG: hypothetical protein F6K28_55350, partial [Microcoleus sp. SIO2G3]|nr:hypothetical protein [Microcoleus sp. SIO2G3]
KKWKSSLYKWQHGDVYLPDLHLKLEQVEFLHECGLLQLLNEPEYHNEHPQVVIVMDFIQRWRWRVQRLFGLHVSKATDPISFLRRMLLKIGLNQFKVRGDGETRFYRVAGFGCVERCAVMQAWNQKYANVIETQPAGECSRLCDRESLTAESIGSIASEGVVSADLDVAIPQLESSSDAPDSLAQGNFAPGDAALLTALACSVSATERQLPDYTAEQPRQDSSKEIEAVVALLSPDRLEPIMKMLTAIDSLESMESFFEEFRRCTEIQQQQIMRRFQHLDPAVKKCVQAWWEQFNRQKLLTGGTSGSTVAAVEPPSVTNSAIEVISVQPEAKAVRETECNVAAIPDPSVQSEPKFGVAEAVAALQRCYVPLDYRQIARQFAADIIQQAIDRLSVGFRTHIRSLHRFVEEYG